MFSPIFALVSRFAEGLESGYNLGPIVINKTDIEKNSLHVNIILVICEQYYRT